MLNNFRLNIRAFFYSLFFGLKSADEIISKKATFKDDDGIHQEKKGGGVFADILEEKQTQEVKEMRDTYYRVLKEADKYEVKITGFQKNDDDNDNTLWLSASATKKGITIPHCEVLETKGYNVEVIQDRKTYENDSESRGKEALLCEEIKDVKNEIFIIERDFMPKFQIEYLIQKAVVKKRKSDGKRKLELYFSIYTRQFVKTDSLFIAEMKRIMEEKYKSDLFEFKTFEFTTDKSFGVDSLHRFKFKINKFNKISIYDGHYVAEFDVTTLIDEDITEKYKTKELTEKYENKAPKHDGVDINTIIRHENIH